MSTRVVESALDDLYDPARRALSGNDQAMLQSSFVRQVASFSELHGHAARASLLRALLARLIRDNESRICDLNYPDNVRALIQAEFQRIKELVANAEDDCFDLQRQPTRCNFRIAGFSRIPVGVNHIESSGIPRSICFRGGPVQCARALRVLWQSGSHVPFYEMHLSHTIRPLRFFLEYNREARLQVYRNVATCLEMNGQYHGLICASWWLDPKMKEVSPRLSDLEKVMLQNGATLFRYGRTANATRHALRNSAKRQKLFDEGEYYPVSFMIVWPREALIAWARRDG